MFNKNTSKKSLLLGTIALLIASFSVVSGFSVSGNKLYDQNGNPVLLRGFARPSLEWSTQGEHLSLADYQLMKNWGANAVRIALNQCFWLSGHAGYDSSYKATVDQQVKWVKSLGMAVILDLHWSDQGNMQLASCGQQNMADANSITFWQQLAPIYKNDPMIIYELYNEPHDVSWNSWLNGGTDGGFTNVGMQQLYNAIRATGANNVVIVNGLNWAFDLSGVASYPVVGTNIVYGTHPYDYAGKQLADYPNAFGYLAAKYPLIATEFGEYNCDPSYNVKFINYANSLSMSWTAWAWYPNGCAFPSAIADWSGTASAAGAPVQNDLKCTNKVPGATNNLCSGSGSTTAPSSPSTTAPSSPSTTAPSSQPPIAATQAPTTVPAGSSVTIYSDYLQIFTDWTWATVRSVADTTYAHSGTSSYSFAPKQYQAVWFVKTGAVDTSVYAGVEFWYYTTGSSDNVHFNIVKGSTGGGSKVGADKTIAAWAGQSSIQANTWTRVYVPFSSLPAGQYDGFWWQDQSGVTDTSVRSYIDDVKMYTISSSTPTPATPAPTVKPTPAPTIKPTPASTPAPATTTKPTPASTPAPTTTPTGTLKIQVHSGASEWWYAVALVNGANGVSVELQDSGSVTTYQPFQATSWGYWLFPSQQNPIKAALSVRVTSSSGKQVVVSIPSISPGAVVDSGVYLN